MTTVTIFGTGNMGSAIGAIFAASGADVAYVNTATTDRVTLGDVVVLAVPFPAVESIAAEYGDQFAGKIVVDITNPIDFQTFQLAVRGEGSAAAAIAALLPTARVVKAFNTNFAQTLAPSGGATVLVAGDDDEAKAVVLNAAKTAGFAGVDAGALSTARELEAMAYLQIQLAFGGKIAGFSVAAA